MLGVVDVVVVVDGAVYEDEVVVDEVDEGGDREEQRVLPTQRAMRLCVRGQQKVKGERDAELCDFNHKGGADGEVVV